jgi:hypothetical protein
MELHFKKRDNCNIVSNKHLSSRIMKAIVEKDRGGKHDGTSCLIWTRRSPIVSMWTLNGSQYNKEPKHCRRIIYEYCIGNVPSGYNVTQTCDNGLICVRPSHLKIIPNGSGPKRSNNVEKKNNTIIEKMEHDGTIHSGSCNTPEPSFCKDEPITG